MHEVRPLTFSLEGEDEAGEHEDGDRHDEEDEAQVPVRLVQRVHQALQTHEVPDHLEDPEYSHDSGMKKKLLIVSNIP